MISPASFNFYQESVARAIELYDAADEEEISIIRKDLVDRADALIAQVPYGLLIDD